jgi:hypothetical protein
MPSCNVALFALPEVANMRTYSHFRHIAFSALGMKSRAFYSRLSIILAVAAGEMGEYEIFSNFQYGARLDGPFSVSLFAGRLRRVHA